jgi:hypothetical protein
VTFEPSEERRLDENVDGAMRDNMRYLNDVLFGDRDYAVIGRTPYQGRA